VFETVDYFEAAREVSHTLQISPRQLFISTDSVNAEEMSQLFVDFHRQLDPHNQHNTWFNATSTTDIPSTWTAASSLRYRTAHGSHTVAAGGGCFTQVSIHSIISYFIC
jgi:hypothetical protein